MVHPKANTADGAKSVNHPQVFTGRKAGTCVAEAAAWRCKCAQPPGYSVGHPTDDDDGLAGVVEATSVGEHTRDRQNLCHAGYDHHAGPGLGVRRRFHADHHLGFRRHFHAGHHLGARPQRRPSSAGHPPTSQRPWGTVMHGPSGQPWLSRPLAVAAAQARPSSIQLRVSKGVAYVKH